jgi:hypothetical protein
MQDVTLKGANDEALYLGYMTKTQNFIAGYSLADEGYVLGVKGDSKKFYHMPTGDDLVRFQQSGLLPNPLPPYQLGTMDYVLGYSLYGVIGFVILWYGIAYVIKKRKAETIVGGQA